MISHERLVSLLRYDEFTGDFVWLRPDGGNKMPPGVVAGWHSGRGAWRIEIDGRNYLAHRLAWLYVHGVWPNGQIDHINGNRSDNRLSNLRVADNSQNQANMGAKSNNGTGVRGVSYKRGVYIVQLYKTVGGEKKRVYGRFRSFGEASMFAVEKSRELHGEFSVFSKAA